MPTIQRRRIGAGPGADHPTLSDFFAALPSDLTVADELWVGALDAAAPHPADATLTAPCDADRYVRLEPASGAGFAVAVSQTTGPLRVDPVHGAVLEGTAAGGLTVAAGARLEVSDLQLRGTGASVVTSLGGVTLSRCLIEGTSADPALDLAAPGDRVESCAIVQIGAGDGVQLAGGTVAASLIAKTDGAPPWSVGVASLSGGAVTDVAVIGFAEPVSGAFDTSARIVHSAEATMLGPLSDMAAWTPSLGATIAVAPTTAPSGASATRVTAPALGFAQATAIPALPAETDVYTISFHQRRAPDVDAMSMLRLNLGAQRADTKIDPRDVSSTGPVGVTLTLALEGFGAIPIDADWTRIWLSFRNANETALEIRFFAAINEAVPGVAAPSGVAQSIDLWGASLVRGLGPPTAPFTPPDAIPSGAVLAGLALSDLVVGPTAGALDLRLATPSPLDGLGGVDQPRDLFGLSRGAPPTLGPIELNGVPPIAPSGLTARHALDRARLQIPTFLGLQSLRSLQTLDASRLDPRPRGLAPAPPHRTRAAPGDR